MHCCRRTLGLTDPSAPHNSQKVAPPFSGKLCGLPALKATPGNDTALTLATLAATTLISSVPAQVECNRLLIDALVRAKAAQVTKRTTSLKGSTVWLKAESSGGNRGHSLNYLGSKVPGRLLYAIFLCLEINDQHVNKQKRKSAHFRPSGVETRDCGLGKSNGVGKLTA